MSDYQEIDVLDESNVESIGATESTLGNAGGPVMEITHWVYRPENER